VIYQTFDKSQKRINIRQSELKTIEIIETIMTTLNLAVTKLSKMGIVSFSVNHVSSILTEKNEMIYKDEKKNSEGKLLFPKGSKKEKQNKKNTGRIKITKTDFPCKTWTSIDANNYKNYIRSNWNGLAMRMGKSTKGEVILGIDVDSVPDIETAENARVLFENEYGMVPYCRTKNGGYHYLLKVVDDYFKKFTSLDGYIEFGSESYKIDLKCNNQVLFTYPTKIIHDGETYEYELLSEEYELLKNKKMEKHLLGHLKKSKKDKSEKKIEEEKSDDEGWEEDSNRENFTDDESSCENEYPKKESSCDIIKHKKESLSFIMKNISDKRSDDMDDWISGGFMIKNELGNDGYSLWKSFSYKSGRYKLSDKDLRKKWSSFKKTKYKAITMDTGIYWLREDNPNKYRYYIQKHSNLKMGDIFNMDYFHKLSNTDKYTYFNYYHAMVTSPLQYLKLEYRNGLIYNIYSYKTSNELQSAYISLTLKNTRKGEDISFINAWFKNRYKKIYAGMDYRPMSSLESTDKDIIHKDSITEDDIYLFNKASTIKILYEKLEDLNELEQKSYEMIDKLLSELCNNDKSVKKYVKNWISYIFQNPGDKPGVALIFLSMEGGIGKNIFWQELIGKRILGENLYNHTLNLGELVNRFNTGMAYKLLTVCDEVEKPKPCEMNYIKALITSDQFNHEEKGKSRTPINDYNRYVFLTNNVNAMRIEKGDRRFVCVESSLKLKGDNKFFEKFKKEVLGNPRILRYYYNYMLTRDIKKFDIRNIPNTQYKKELEGINRSVYIKSLEKNYMTYADKFITYTDLYQDVENYCSEHRDKEATNKYLMTKEYDMYQNIMKKERQGKARTWGYKFMDLKTLSDYFEY